jgi:hypothetical protein
MNRSPVPVIIPSLLPESKLLPLAEEIRSSAGYPHRVILSCSRSSAAVNRNLGLDLAAAAGLSTEVVVMLDDDIRPLTEGWLDLLMMDMSRTGILMVSAQLYKPGGGYAYMTGLDDWGGQPHHEGETVVPTKKLLTACCAFRPSGYRFDEGYVGSGFEDVDLCNQLSAADPSGAFLVCHDAHVIHYNEQREQRGENWEKNKALYESKWGRVETREEMRVKYRGRGGWSKT